MHIETRITQSAYDFLFLTGRPALLSLIAIRGAQHCFYERLSPINLPVIFHVKVMSRLAVTEVISERD